MTAVQYVEYILRNHWEDNISGRPHDVGEIDDDIKVVYEGDKDWRRMDLANFDYLALTDGGISNYTPRTFGWSQEDIDAVVTIDVRTRGWSNQGRPGRIALYGERGAGELSENESPRWGGLTGETVRVFRDRRQGDEEWDLIKTPEVNDLTGQMGGGIWRASVTIGLESRASTIDTDP